MASSAVDTRTHQLNTKMPKKNRSKGFQGFYPTVLQHGNPRTKSRAYSWLGRPNRTFTKKNIAFVLFSVLSYKQSEEYIETE